MQSLAPTTHRRLDIQGLRALAVCAVVIFHAGLPLPGGFAGVDMFFVISGYVIAAMLVKELESTGRLDWKTFYARRVRRLLPALAAMSTVTACVAILFNPIGTQVTTALTGISASLFAANGYLYRSAPGYFSPGAEFNPMLHTWSLAVEEQFYFFFPVLLALVWRFRVPTHHLHLHLRRRRTVLLLTGLIVVSFAVACGMSFGYAVLPKISAPAQFAFYASPTRAWEFAVGALLVFTPAWMLRMRTAAATWLGCSGLAVVLGACLWIDGNMRFPGWVAWLPVGGTALLIVGGSAQTTWVTRLFSSPAAVWLGDRSYGWYLWHWPFVVFARTLFPDSPSALVVASVLSLVPAWASHRFIETPLRSAHHTYARSTIRLALACVAIPVMAFLLLLASHWGIFKYSGTKAIGEALQLHADSERGCEGLSTFGGPLQQHCTWHVPNAKGVVMLLGDSNAGQLTEPVIQAAHAAGYDVTVATFAACPFVALDVYGGGVKNERCAAYVNAALSEVARSRPNLVVLASASDGYIEEPSTQLGLPGGKPTADTPDSKAALWNLGLTAALDRIAPFSPVILVHPVPRFRTWSLASCAAYKVMFNPDACVESSPRLVVDAWRKRAVAAENLAISRTFNASALDFTDALCPASICTVVAEGRWMYRDGAHLSVPGAQQLTSEFKRVIDNRARK